MWQERQKWRKELTRRMTIMVIPHGTTRPRQFTFSIPFLMFMLTFWTGVTAWASFLASERLDYWRVKANSHILRIKVEYFANEMKQAREMLDEVKEADAQLRALIGMGNKDAIIQSETPLHNTGGPTPEDGANLQKLMDGKVAEMSMQDVSRQVQILRQETESRLASYKMIHKQIDQERRLFRATPIMWPVNGAITSHFGGRLSPFSGQSEFHGGMDIGASAGTPVRATADGTVQIAGWAGGYGKVVVINHEFGYSTRYGHNRQVLVKRGDRVKRGQIIALVGSTGHATGPHCHYEVWYLGRCINPRKFMRHEG